MLHTRLRQLVCDWKGNLPGWLISLILHLFILCLVSILSVPAIRRNSRLTVSIPYSNEEQIELPPQQFEFRELDVDDIGSDSRTADQLDLTDVALPEPDMELLGVEAPTNPLGNLEFEETLAVTTGVDFAKNYATRGQVGVGLNSARGAIDRLTHEILLSLEERPTLVVWLLDQSPSLIRQRVDIRAQLDRVYDELGSIQASGAFAHYEEQPLLSAVLAFGERATLLTEKPTANVDRLQEAFATVTRDDSGIENIYGAILSAAKKYRSFRRASGPDGQPLRNVMIVAFTDEAGDDQTRLNETVDACSRYAIPVYVVGVPAPFGQVETFVKWVDPDPNYDQTPQWAMVNQGPESLMPERVKLAFVPPGEYEAPLDSGFGPFGLTRLAYETGGIYFALHPNRGDRRIRRRRLQAFTAHISKFYDEETMRRYKPDYVSEATYRQELSSNSTREALVKAAQDSWIHPMEEPQLEFVARDTASFVAALTEAQKTAAKLEPRLNRLHSVLKTGESGREEENSPRWQAGFDLAMGRTLATLARTRTYNAILAKAKRGLEPTHPQNNYWELRASDAIDINSQLEQLGNDARRYLNRVVSDHPDTPWATLAARELQRPLGWEWHDSFRMLPEDIARMRANNPMPQDDRVRMLPRRPPTREVPRL